jgi:hypothetical protein
MLINLDTESEDYIDQIRAQLWTLGYRATVIPRRDSEWMHRTRARQCAYCGKKFEVDRPSKQGKYCRWECFHRDRIGSERKHVHFTPAADLKRRCPQCKKHFQVAKRSERKKFCTPDCYHDWRVGKPNGSKYFEAVYRLPGARDHD